jgi:hypothetical protein
MDIKEAQYYKSAMPGSDTFIKVTESNGKVWYVPQNPKNSDYEEILKQVKEGTLTIKDAE